MKYIITYIIVFTVFISCTSKVPQLKISGNQEKVAAFIKKYQDSVLVALDSASKNKIFMNMWMKRYPYIHDSLKISYNTIDTFIFEKVMVKDSIDPKDDKAYLQIVLDNGNYAVEANYTGEKKEYLQESPIYRMAKNLNEHVPVKVIGNLDGIVSLSQPNVAEGMKKIMLNIRIDSVFNAY